MSVNMLPSYKALRKNRQYGVMTKTFTRAFVAMVLFLGVWTGGVVLPQFLESQRVGRDFENLRAEAETITVRLEGQPTALKKQGVILTSCDGAEPFWENLSSRNLA